MKTKAKQRYRNESGEILPGVTTLTGMLGWNKQILINWSNKKGLEGIDVNKYVDNLAEVGTLAHKIVTNSILGYTTSTDDYSMNQIKLATNCAESWFGWVKGKKVEPILVETPLVSERLGYGGTPDIYAKIDGVPELIDLKTGARIYPEMIIQVTAYQQLLYEHGHESEKVRILNIPRTKGESFVEREVTVEEGGIAWEIFIHCLEIYKLKKGLK